MMDRIRDYLASWRPKKKVAKQKKPSSSISTQKDMFFANMSHEIRTPVNGIVGFTQLLKETNLDREQHELVDTIHASSMHLLGLVNDILDFSKINAHKMQLEETEFDLLRQIEDTVDTYAATAQEKGIVLTLYIDPSISPILLGDPSKLSQILINLISNAVKFTDRLGTVDIRVEKVLEGQKMVTLRFSVRDSGLGISTGAQKNIFNAFAQANSSISRRFGGTGLGLAISSELVKLMGGELTVESEPDEGAEFYFTIAFEKVRSHERKIYEDLYRGLSAGIVVAQKGFPGTTEKNLKSYIEYLGVNTRFYSSVELVSMAKKALPDLLLVDDRSVGIDLQSLAVLGTIVILLSSIDRRSSVMEKHGNICENIYKPVNLTKTIRAFKSCLEKEKGVEEEAYVNRNFKGFRALVVDDNSINQKLMLQVLENMQMDVELASNGEEAVRYYEETNPDIIFMDIQMPIMDGLEAAEKIVTLEKSQGRSHAPIVALTGNIEKEDTERYIDAGMDGFLSKPVDITVLLSYLNKFLATKHVVQHMESRERLFEGTKALIVEENSINQSLLERALAGRGVESRSVSRAGAVMELYADERFDILLMSASMPMVSASDVIVSVRTHEAKQGWRTMPIILIVPEDISESQCDAYQKEGVEGFLFKPLDIDAIKMELERCMMYDLQEKMQEHHPSSETPMLSDTATGILEKMAKAAPGVSAADTLISEGAEEKHLEAVENEAIETEMPLVLLPEQEGIVQPQEHKTEHNTAEVNVSTDKEDLSLGNEAPTEEEEIGLLYSDEPETMEVKETSSSPSAFLVEDHLPAEIKALLKDEKLSPTEAVAETKTEKSVDAETETDRLQVETVEAYEKALQELKEEKESQDKETDAIEEEMFVYSKVPKESLEVLPESQEAAEENAVEQPDAVLLTEVQESIAPEPQEEAEKSEISYELLSEAGGEREDSIQEHIEEDVTLDESAEEEGYTLKHLASSEEETGMSEPTEETPAETDETAKEPEEADMPKIDSAEEEMVTIGSHEEESAVVITEAEDIPVQADPLGEAEENIDSDQIEIDTAKRTPEEESVGDEAGASIPNTVSEEKISSESDASEKEIEVVEIGETTHVVQYIDIPFSK